MTRSRTTNRGKKIYWNTPIRYINNLNGTYRYLSTNASGPDSRPYDFILWNYKNPLHVTHIAIASDNDGGSPAGAVSLRILKNENVVYTTDSESGFTADIPSVFPIRPGARVRINNGERYGLQMRTAGTTGNECEAYLIGYYYLDENEGIYFESQMSYCNGVDLVGKPLKVWQLGAVVGDRLYYPDTNSMRITAVGMSTFSSDSILTSVFAQIYVNNVNVVETTAFPIDVNNETIVKLTRNIFVKPTDEVRVILIDGLDKGVNVMGRYFGLRKELQGSYRFVSNVLLLRSDVDGTIEPMFTQVLSTNNPAIRIVLPWDLARLVGMVASSDNSLVEKRLFSLINGATAKPQLVITSSADGKESFREFATTGNPYYDKLDAFGCLISTAGITGGECGARLICEKPL